MNMVWGRLFDDPRPIKIFGNLPFNIATPFLIHLLRKFYQQRRSFKAIVLLQKEMVERICAKEGEHNRLSVLIQNYCEVMPLMQLSRAAFTPRPHVDASLLHLIMRRSPIAGDETTFDQWTIFLQHLFAMRRKTLRQNLIHGLRSSLHEQPTKLFLDNMTHSTGIPLHLRSQDLSLVQIAALCRYYKPILFKI
jgi:16S rRNA (adenine1518-N6/adenine1519-N6)-dimethyltransferase